MTRHLSLMLFCILLGCGGPKPPALTPGKDLLSEIQLPLEGATHDGSDEDTVSYRLPDASPDAAAERWMAALSHPDVGWTVGQNRTMPNGIRLVGFDRGIVTLSVLFANDNGTVVAMISKR